MTVTVGGDQPEGVCAFRVVISVRFVGSGDGLSDVPPKAPISGPHFRFWNVVAAVLDPVDDSGDGELFGDHDDVKDHHVSGVTGLANKSDLGRVGKDRFGDEGLALLEPPGPFFSRGRGGFIRVFHLTVRPALLGDEIGVHATKSGGRLEDPVVERGFPRTVRPGHDMEDRIGHAGG